MNKRISKFIALSVLALPFTAFAQDLGQVKVTIPFAFKAAGVTMPAGDYTVVEANEAGLLRITGNKSGAMMITAPGRITGNETATLEFEQTKAGNVLKEVRMSNRASNVLPTFEQ